MWVKVVGQRSRSNAKNRVLTHVFCITISPCSQCGRNDAMVQTPEVKPKIRF